MKKAILIIAGLFLITLVSPISWAADLGGKKILFVDSYHEGYAWSDGITQGIKDVVSSTGANLKIFRMDTKRNGSDEFKTQAALKAKALIEEFKPDVVIAADDNASKFLIMPFYKNADLPVVFCGVNWDGGVYGYPYKNATGMVEVTPMPQLIEQLKPFAEGEKIGFLGPDMLTSRKEVDNLKKTFGLQVATYFAKDFEDWKKGFKQMQEQADIVYLDTDGGLYKDHADEMKSFVESNTIKPTGASYDFMAPYALITFAKIAREQGQWAGDAAVKILSGTPASTIPIAQNKEGELIINARIAGALDLEIPFEILESAGKIIE
ncbi:ABC transporter substrate-binding protein [Desulfospira joergensenii]|uniref:ABC transporter substrate-binding protein n=1 Tax=Desulfospira joergensenii TaxID=53329 RepID=UPI0003B37845|nr:ABC transporter substrate binding protein [Desulfospira joergensenii]